MEFVFQAALLGISAALSPGPFQSLVIAQALLGGWRRALPITLAPLIGDIPVALVLVFLLNRVPTTFLTYIRFAGAALLLFLAWDMWQKIRASKHPALEIEETPPSFSRGLVMGLAMLLLSPGPYLFWSLVLGPLLLSALDVSIVQALIFLISFYIFSIGGLNIIAILVTRLGQLNRSFHYRLQQASLVIMLVIAFFLVQNGLQQLA